MESATDNAEAKPLGRILAEEREKQGLSRADAAQRLHMSAFQVEALESGDYARLPRGTFLRGFVRNYGKLLGLDAEAMVSHLAQAAPRGPAPGIVVPSQNIRFDPLGERLANPYVKAAALAVVAVAMIFAAMYWWLFIRPAPPAVSKPEPASQATRSGPPQQLAAAPMAAPDPVAPSPAPTTDEAASAAPDGRAASAAPQRSEPARATKAEAAKAGTRTLRFRFRGESWVEVRDVQGRSLLSRLNAKGTEAEVAGRPPLSVIVGNAPEVDMFYDDRPFALQPHTRVAVARFTLD